MKTIENNLAGLIMAFLFSIMIGNPEIQAQSSLPDSIIFKGLTLDTGQTFRTGYFTNFGHYTMNSYFKEPGGNEHLAYVDNYKLYYFKSTDDGTTWYQEQVITAHEGDIWNCSLTVDADGKVFIGFTVNDKFNFANPTGVIQGQATEFLYDLYCVTNKTGNWVTELVNLHAGNYGPKIAGLFVDANNNVHIIANYYGWYSNGGTSWEWVRNAVSNTWGTRIQVVKFTDAVIDRVMYDTYTIVPDQNGNVTMIMCRNISATAPAPQKSRLFYVRFNGTSWAAPVTITDAIAVAWNRFDAFVDTAGHTWIAYLENNTLKVPELKMIKDFGPVQTASLNLAPGDTLNYFRLHCNAEGLFTMYMYLNTKNPKIQIVFSHDAVHWSNPVPVPAALKNYMWGMIVRTDTRRGYFTDYCKQIYVTAGPRTAQPYGPFGPDTLFYGSIGIRKTPTGINREIIPVNAMLGQNYPNPFASKTRILLRSDVDGWLTLKVFDFVGREIVMLMDGYRSAGSYVFDFDGNTLPGGIYFYQLKAGNSVKTKKMLLIK